MNLLARWRPDLACKKHQAKGKTVQEKNRTWTEVRRRPYHLGEKSLGDEMVAAPRTAMPASRGSRA